MIEFTANGGSAQGYVTGSGPGVIVIQEWWGLNDQIKGVADRFASEGFTALAPDFYHGKGAQIGEPDEAGKLMMSLDIDRAAKDARGAAAALAERTGGRVGVIGFCMGGQLALLTGTVAPEQVAAVVDMYGIHPAVKPDFSRMKARVLALFGGLDASIDEAARAGLAKALADAGCDFEIDVYPQAGHAFFNELNVDGFDKEAADDAWRRILALFRATL